LTMGVEAVDNAPLTTLVDVEAVAEVEIWPAIAKLKALMACKAQ